MKRELTIIHSLVSLSLLLGITSCGKSSSGSGGSARQLMNQEHEKGDAGIYRAVLKSLNTNIAGDVSGTLQIKIKESDFKVSASVVGAPSGVKHLQNIVTASRCPEMADDKNSDGVVDMKEALQGGQILLPLDADLSEQLAGMDYGPIANASGSYLYKRSADFSHLLADLQDADPDLMDGITKLSAGQIFALDTRVVIIHGVRHSADVPETAAALSDRDPSEFLPIACGKLIRVKDEDSSTENTGTVDSGSN